MRQQHDRLPKGTPLWIPPYIRKQSKNNSDITQSFKQLLERCFADTHRNLKVSQSETHQQYSPEITII